VIPARCSGDLKPRAAREPLLYDFHCASLSGMLLRFLPVQPVARAIKEVKQNDRRLSAWGESCGQCPDAAGQRLPRLRAFQLCGVWYSTA